jgi:hypothetical protein
MGQRGKLEKKLKNSTTIFWQSVGNYCLNMVIFLGKKKIP